MLILNYVKIWIDMYLFFAPHTNLHDLFFLRRTKRSKTCFMDDSLLSYFFLIFKTFVLVSEKERTLYFVVANRLHNISSSRANNWRFSPAITPNMYLLSRCAATTTVARSLAGAVRIRCIRFSRRMTADGRAFSRRRRSRKSLRESTLQK